MPGDLTDEERALVQGMPQHVAAGYIAAKRAAEAKQQKQAESKWDWDSIAAEIADMVKDAQR